MGEVGGGPRGAEGNEDHPEPAQHRKERVPLPTFHRATQRPSAFKFGGGKTGGTKRFKCGMPCGWQQKGGRMKGSRNLSRSHSTVPYRWMSNSEFARNSHELSTIAASHGGMHSAYVNCTCYRSKNISELLSKFKFRLLFFCPFKPNIISRGIEILFIFLIRF